MGTAASAQRAHRSLFGPTVYGLALLGLRIAVPVAGLAAAYLLFGLLSGQLGQFTALPRPERVRVLGNILLAKGALETSLIIAVVLVVYLYWMEETAGYVLALIGAVLLVGIPYVLTLFPATQATGQNFALRSAAEAFPLAARWAFLGGGILILRDVSLRLSDLLRQRPLARESLEYGGDAQAEVGKRPVRLAVLGKCWEGPYCRDFIRVHCPIFQTRKACWRVKRGCYCEEDIVSNAMRKISGQHLDMAPDPRFNFAHAPAAARKRELTPAQKRERCRNCVIYNEHQRQKYALLMPALIVGVLAAGIVFSPALREYLGLLLGALETLMGRFTFGDTSGGFSFRFGRPSPMVEWVFVGALVVMALSKALQALEWAVFKIKV